MQIPLNVSRMEVFYVSRTTSRQPFAKEIFSFKHVFDIVFAKPSRTCRATDAHIRASVTNLSPRIYNATNSYDSRATVLRKHEDIQIYYIWRENKTSDISANAILSRMSRGCRTSEIETKRHS